MNLQPYDQLALSPAQASLIIVGISPDQTRLQHIPHDLPKLYLCTNAEQWTQWSLQLAQHESILLAGQLPSPKHFFNFLDHFAQQDPSTNIHGQRVFWEADSDLKISHWPEATGQFFQLGESEILSQNLSRLPVELQTGQSFAALIQARNQQSDTTQFSAQLITPQGERLALRIDCFRKNPKTEEEKTGFSFFAEALSPTEKKPFPSELPWRRLIEHSSDAVLICSSTAEMLYLSPSVEQISGFEVKHLLGQNALDYVHPDLIDSLLEQLNKLLAKELHLLELRLRLRLRHKDGHYFWVAAKIYDRRDVAGIHGLVVNYQPVDELFRTREELKASLQRFRWASLATQDVIWEYEVKSGKLFWGENMSSILGVFDPPLNHIEQFLAQVEPNQRQALKNSLTHFPPAPEDYWQAEYRFRDGQDRWLYIHDQGYLVRDKEGKVLKVIGAMRDLSPEKAFEQKINASEYSFRLLFEKALVGIGQLDQETHFLAANAALENLLGYSSSDLTELTLGELIHSDDRALLADWWKNLVETKSLVPAAIRLKRRDGLYADCMASAFAESAKGQSRYWCYFLDLSQTQKTSNALAKVQRRLNELVENASDVLVVLNEESKYEYITANIEKLLGYQPEEMLGKDNLHYMHPEDCAEVEAAFAKAVANFGEDSLSRFRALHKNGQWVWVEVNGKMRLNPQGKPEAIMHVRKLEDGQKYHQEILKKAKAAELSAQSILITDADERIEWANESFSSLSGYSLEEAKGKRITELLHGPESQETYENFVRDKLRRGEAFSIETVNYHKNGFPYWIESNVNPIRDQQGKLLGFVAIEKDISKRRLQYNALKDQLNELNQHHRKLRRYSYTLSHNFRSHVSNIMSISQELQREDIAEEEHDALCTLLHQSSLELNQSLTSLNQELETKRDDTANLQPLALEPVLERVLRQLKIGQGQREEKLELKIQPKLFLLGREAYLESVFYNLLSNALRYRDPKRPLVLRLEAQRSQDAKIWVQICDNGLGMNLEENIDKLFALHESFHDHPDSQGIGLYLVREQLKMMQATIEVESQVGQGSCFRLGFQEAEPN